MNTAEYVLGELCKVLLPIPEEIYFGNKNSSVAICTLSSIPLLKAISSSDLLDDVAVVGRLLSENRGIDALIRFVNSNENIKTIILCGKEVSGHRTGGALLALHENGIDGTGRIVSCTSPDPVLKVDKNQVNQFQSQVSIIDRIGETDLSVIRALVDSKS